MIGGQTTGTQGELDLVYMYEPEGDKWIKLENATLSTARSYVSAFTIPFHSLPDC